MSLNTPSSASKRRCSCSKTPSDDEELGTPTPASRKCPALGANPLRHSDHHGGASTGGASTSGASSIAVA
ncbi:hypothetical protein CFD26_100508 [Aspergillus turcosus]|uniref:Uncharacterized protein n=1 Tax=Aspergillus turcosus TaxID=1245748 RepID=A0A421CT91_9EURO|nr:hypothetical protein CFD26_100508 [Aspergillus turcosus]